MAEVVRIMGETQIFCSFDLDFTIFIELIVNINRASFASDAKYCSSHKYVLTQETSMTYVTMDFFSC